MSLNSTKLAEATRLVRAGRLADATALLQGRAASPNDNADPAAAASFRAADEPPQPSLPKRIRDYFEAADRARFADKPDDSAPPASPAPDGGGHFLAETYADSAGGRPYRLYIPSGYHGQPVPLIVMLHGCTQSAQDFAKGTRMNEAAESETCLVVYPEQIATANQQKCWNWFNPSDQHRDTGEPSLIAGITRTVIATYAVDPERVYIAGLSAGGAQAAIMGATYPDLYAAIGIHSGLASGIATDLPSALAAMRRGGSAKPSSSPLPPRPVIVFHGDQDKTVHPRNAEAVIAQSLGVEHLAATSEQGRAPGGRAFTRVRHRNAAGGTLVEQWTVHGGGHAWSGGSSSGSYTDPQGPDATRAMMDFFLAHRGT